MIQTFLVPTAGRQIDAAGNFFRYESADVGATDQTIKLRIDGNDLGTFLPGDSIELPIMATRFEVIPATGAATVRVGVGRITTARMTLAGNVIATIASNKSATSAAFANTAKTVTSASTQLIAANTARQYLMIQNRDATGNIFLNFGAAAATQANGIKITPGGFWEWDTTIPTTAIQAIGDIASNANILVVEG